MSRRGRGRNGSPPPPPPTPQPPPPPPPPPPPQNWAAAGKLVSMAPPTSPAPPAMPRKAASTMRIGFLSFIRAPSRRRPGTSGRDARRVGFTRPIVNSPAGPSPAMVNSRIAQPVQHLAGREAVGNQARASLEIPDGNARARTKDAVRLADVEAAARKMLLQLEPFGAGERALVARPFLRKRVAATQTVG